MLRITTRKSPDSEVTLVLEGSIVSIWVDLLHMECRHAWDEGAAELRLDFGGVTYVDRHGAELVQRLQRQGVEVLNCSELIRCIVAVEN